MSTGIVSYATYLPAFRVRLADLGAALTIDAGTGSRVVAGYDEDSTTLAVAAAAAALDRARVRSLHFATTTPAYADKTNATAVHAALGLPADVFVTDVCGSARSAVAAWRSAAAGHGLAVFADVRVGRPGSSDERGGGDGAAAFVFGPATDSLAAIVSQVSITGEFLDRWRAPGAVAGQQWEERFGVDQYGPLIDRAWAAILARVGDPDSMAVGDQPDHLVVVSPNAGVVKTAGKRWSGCKSTTVSPIGHSGTADLGLALARILDTAGPDETILVVSAADGCDAILLRTTDLIEQRRQRVPVATQLAAGVDVSYTTYLSWRGLLDREPPRRPEPDRPAAPPSARGVAWKFGLTASSCTTCGFVHLPPARVCKNCRSVDAMTDEPRAHMPGTVATFTVDRLAYSPAPPVVAAVVDFDGGGRYTLELADGAAQMLAVGSRVRPVFRRLYTAGGVHNYFWKAVLL
ncbi:MULTISPECIES: OB-fold domain-containing protein [unclassified Nocardia]|uniref:OB-fold domain-containing protein n=1 Tax=unclassified Nocardia TaxID=2637762 RepID=UPI0035DA59A7